MVRKNFIFFKNVRFNHINTFFLDMYDKNFIFFEKINNFFIIKTSFIKIKKINFNKKCINIVYF